MKIYGNLSFWYGVLGLISGVFYREFTKFNGFEGRTALGFTHLHFIVLGCILFMIVGILSNLTDIENKKEFKIFMKTYNIGLVWTVAMLYARGIVQILNISLEKSQNAMLSGFAGIGHILLGVGFVSLLLSVKKLKFNSGK